MLQAGCRRATCFATGLTASRRKCARARGLGIRWSHEDGFAGHPLHVTLGCAHAASFISAAIVSHATAIC